MSDAAADRLSASYIDDYLAACELYSDVKPTLARMEAYQMGIVSNGERCQQQYKLVKTGIDRYFGPLILSGEYGVAKPARGIFELACDSMGGTSISGHLCRRPADVNAEAAQSVGMQAFG
jgi:putative hydrolase of the HAD superfamily